MTVGELRRELKDIPADTLIVLSVTDAAMQDSVVVTAEVDGVDWIDAETVFIVAHEEAAR